jgi:hypothetical protein
VSPEFVDSHVIFGALTGAITWNLVTWYYGIPSSSSHALIGGMIGAAMAKAGTDPLIMAGILKITAFIVVSPMLGLLWGSLLMLGVSWLFFRSSTRRADKVFRRLQLISSALYSIGHGSNDAQKTMGIIWLLLIGAGVTTQEHLPFWVVISCYLAIGFGTLFGGWRIVKRSPNCARRAVSPPRPAGHSRSSSRPAWACPSRPRTPSPGPSSEWGRFNGRRPCGGASRAASSRPGSSRSRLRRSLRQSGSGRRTFSFRLPEVARGAFSGRRLRVRRQKNVAHELTRPRVRTMKR